MTDHLPARRHLPEPDDAEVVDGELEDHAPPRPRVGPPPVGKRVAGPSVLRQPRVSIEGRLTDRAFREAPQSADPAGTTYVVFDGLLVRLEVDEITTETIGRVW